MQAAPDAAGELEMERPTKFGNVRQSEFEGEEFLGSLDPVVGELAVEVAAAKMDRKALATLSAGLQQFQENALGINAYPPKAFPKLPATLFRDTRPRGALFVIAAASARTMLARGLKRLDFTNPALRKQNMEILGSVRRSLQQAGLLKPFKVALNASLDAAQLPRLQGIISRLGAELAADVETPGCTHVVYPFGPSGDPDDGLNYMRSLEARGTEVRVHWWYKPDSYDEFIPATTAPADLEPDTDHPGVWQVYVRWLLDSEKYNEWMNPGDYETEAGIAAREAVEATAGVGSKRKGEDVSGPTAKRAAAISSAPEVSAWSEALGNGVVRQTILTPHAAAMDGSATVFDLSFRQRPPEARGVPVALRPSRSLSQLTGPFKAVLGKQPSRHPDAREDTVTRPTLEPPSAATAPATSMKVEDDVSTSTPTGVPLAEVKAEPGLAKDEPIEAMAGLGPPTVGTAEVKAEQSIPTSKGVRVEGGITTAAAVTTAADAAASTHYDGPSAVTSAPYPKPAHAGWYDPKEVHVLECHLLPGGPTDSAPLSAEAYREQRAAAVAAYGRDPLRRLTCVEAETLGVVPRVWAFLDSWGIINYTAVDGLPLPLLGVGNSGNSSSNGSSVQDLFAFAPVTLADALAAAACGSNATTPLLQHCQVADRQPMTPPLVTVLGADGGEQRHTCTAMPWVDCTAVRYEWSPPTTATSNTGTSTTGSSSSNRCIVNLCLFAFAEGRFPAGTSARDFRLVRGPRGSRVSTGRHEEWSHEETLLLLEGIQLYGEVWPDVAAHVGTKPSFKCALRFLQLPIEEGFLEAALSPTDGEEVNLPFADAGNPVMALLALLAAVVAPPVAAAAGQRALQVLSQWEGDPNTPFPRSVVQSAAAAALQAAATKAKILADEEERSVQVLVAEAAKAQAELVRQKISAVSAMDGVVGEAATEAAVRATQLQAHHKALQATPLPELQPLPVPRTAVVSSSDPLQLTPVPSSAMGGYTSSTTGGYTPNPIPWNV